MQMPEKRKMIIRDTCFFIFQILTGCILLAVLDFYPRREIAAGFIVWTLISGLGSGKKYELFMKQFHTKAKKILFCVLCLYSAFTLVGNRAVVYPIENIMSLKDCAEVFLAFVWSVQAELTVFYLIDILIRKAVRDSKEDGKVGNQVVFGVLVFFSCMVPLTLTLIAFNPGISDSDMSYSLYFAKHLDYCIDWFPPFYYMFLRAVITVVDSVYAIVITQYLFYTFVITEAAFLLRQFKVKDGFIILIVLLLSFNPANMLQLTWMCKDALYLCSLLWLTIILSRISLDMPYKKPYAPLLYMELVMALVGTFFFRKNGIIPAIIVILALLILCIKKKSLLLPCIISLALIVLVQCVVYPAFHVRDYRDDPSKQGDAYIGLGQDLRGVYFSGGDISQETLDIVEQLNEDELYPYNVTYYGNWKADLKVEFGQFIRCYLDTFIKNPIRVINAVFCRNDAIWSIYHGDFGDVALINFYGKADGTTVGGGNHIIDVNGNRVTEKWNDYAPARRENVLTGIVSKYTDLSAEHDICKVILWRSGLHVWVLMAAAVLLIIKKKNLILPYLVIIGQVISLLLACGWSVFRYYWPINVVSVFLILVSALKAYETGNDQEAIIIKNVG